MTLCGLRIFISGVDGCGSGGKVQGAWEGCLRLWLDCRVGCRLLAMTAGRGKKYALLGFVIAAVMLLKIGLEFGADFTVR